MFRRLAVRLSHLSPITKHLPYPDGIRMSDEIPACAGMTRWKIGISKGTRKEEVKTASTMLKQKNARTKTFS